MRIDPRFVVLEQRGPDIIDWSDGGGPWEMRWVGNLKEVEQMRDEGWAHVFSTFQYWGESHRMVRGKGRGRP